MIAFLSAIEPLRIANRFSNNFYDWLIFSANGGAVTASNGMKVMTDNDIQAAVDIKVLFVCSGFEPLEPTVDNVADKLRELSLHGIALGAIDTGCYLLAASGLLSNYRATLHWESIAAFKETYPQVKVSYGLFEFDRDRYTCAGGTAAMDMMLHLITRTYDDKLAIKASEQLLHERIRNPADNQRMHLFLRLGVNNKKLLTAVETMERNLENPLPAPQLADICNLSLRQLERLFKQHLGTTPIGYYLQLRLERAQQMLQQTDMNIVAIAIACGFGSMAYFSRAYRKHFACSPSQDRSN